MNQVPGTATGDNTHNTTGQSSTSRQPLDQSLRQESYTNDTDRSFPLAGGVAPKHNPTSTHTTTTTTTTHHNPLHQSTSTQPIDGTSSSHHPTTSSREPGTKEKGVGVHDGHGREGLAGAAAAAAAVGTAGAFSQSHQRDTHVQGLETREATYGDESLAGSSTVSFEFPICEYSQDYLLQWLEHLVLLRKRFANDPPAPNKQLYDPEHTPRGSSCCHCCGVKIGWYASTRPDARHRKPRHLFR